MSFNEAANTWTFTGSTGRGKAFDCRGYPQCITFGYETSSGCTGTMLIEHRMGSSAGPYSVISSTSGYAMSTGEFVTDQYMGPLEWVRPRLASLTAGSTNIVRVYLKGN